MDGDVAGADDAGAAVGELCRTCLGNERGREMDGIPW